MFDKFEFRKTQTRTRMMKYKSVKNTLCCIAILEKNGDDAKGQIENASIDETLWSWDMHFYSARGIVGNMRIKNVKIH